MGWFALSIYYLPLGRDRKNGHRRGKQNHICVKCNRQFIDEYSHRGYSDDVKRLCIRMYVNGMGFRAIERVTGVSHTAVIGWVKQEGEHLPDAYDPEETPEVGELDELQTFVGRKKDKVWIWTAKKYLLKPLAGKLKYSQPLKADHLNLICRHSTKRLLRLGFWQSEFSVIGLEPKYYIYFDIDAFVGDDILILYRSDLKMIK